MFYTFLVCQIRVQAKLVYELQYFIFSQYLVACNPELAVIASWLTCRKPALADHRDVSWTLEVTSHILVENMQDGKHSSDLNCF